MDLLGLVVPRPIRCSDRFGNPCRAKRLESIARGDDRRLPSLDCQLSAHIVGELEGFSDTADDLPVSHRPPFGVERTARGRGWGHGRGSRLVSLAATAIAFGEPSELGS
jgi:hypothetical protein